MRVWCEKSGSLAGPASRKKRRHDSPRRPPVDAKYGYMRSNSDARQAASGSRAQNARTFASLKRS